MVGDYGGHHDRGMGTVYRASQALLHRPTAVKLIHQEGQSDQALRRFEAVQALWGSERLREAYEEPKRVKAVRERNPRSSIQVLEEASDGGPASGR